MQRSKTMYEEIQTDNGLLIRCKGFNHFGCGFWQMELTVPDGYKVIRKGHARKGDMCMGAMLPLPKRKKKPGFMHKLKAQWVDVLPHNIGKDAKYFTVLIRKNGKTNELHKIN